MLEKRPKQDKCEPEFSKRDNNKTYITIFLVVISADLSCQVQHVCVCIIEGKQQS